MGVNAEGKISLSVELQNFKDIASDLKKGLSAQLKQVPLDIEFNNKELEEKAAKAVQNINNIISKSRIKNLDLSSILPTFVNEINKEGTPEEERMQMIKGFEAALTNLRDVGIKQDYNKLKLLNGDELKTYIADLNDVVDILNTIDGLTERQKQGILTTVLPSLSDLSGRGKDAAKKEYTKGAKRLDAILQLSGDYNDVLQYGVNPTATLSALNELNKKAKSGKKLTKNEGQDLLGYLSRGKFLGLEFGKAEDENLKDLDYEYLLQSAKKSLDEATIKYIENKSTEYFAALDKIYKSSAQEITYSDLTKGIKNTTNQKMQSLYDAEAPENPPTRIRAGSITKKAIKLRSKEKPELRKRNQEENKEHKEDTKKTKSPSEEDEVDNEFEFDDEEDFKKEQIEKYKKQIEQIDNELDQIGSKLDKAQDKEFKLKAEIKEQKKIFEDKDKQYWDFKNEYDNVDNSIRNAQDEANILKETIASFDTRLEEEKQKKQEIENKYNELIAKREDIKKEIEEKENQLQSILPSIKTQEENLEKQLLDLSAKKTEENNNIKSIQENKNTLTKSLDEELNWFDAILQKEYQFKGSKAKSEAYDVLKRFGKLYSEFRKNPDFDSPANKDEAARFTVKHYKLWQAAKEAGVADSRLETEAFDSDNDFDYQRAVEYLKQRRNNTEQRRKEIHEQFNNEIQKNKTEITELETEIKQVEAQQKELQEKKKKLLYELRERPFTRQEDNEAGIKFQERKLAPVNSEISKIEKQKEDAENRLSEAEEYLDRNKSFTGQKEENEKQLEQLKKDRDAQKQIYEQKKADLEKARQEQNDIDKRWQELEDEKKDLLQRQAKAEKELKELQQKRAVEKKQEAEQQAQQENKPSQENKSEEKAEEKESSKTEDGAVSTATSISPEKLQKILTLLGNIQKALGTLEDGSDIPSITQSVKDMADALKKLSTALGEIKQKDFNLNIGLPNNNPIGQQGEAKRKILKELEKQYNELDSYFTNKYGDDSSAFNALSKLEGGSNYVKTMMSDFSIIGDTNAPLADKINVYKTLIEQLRSFVIQEGGDLNKIVSNTLSPDKIIEQINKDISNTNPATAITKLFEKMQVSIDASLAQINTESQGFNFLSGSAEEAAAAKQKFVEANKDVLQSIIASMPKIEQEAEALEKVEDIKKDNAQDNTQQGKVKQEQDEIIKQEQLKLQAQKRVEQEKDKIHQKFEQIKQQREQRRKEQEEQIRQQVLEQEQKEQEEQIKQEQLRQAEIRRNQNIEVRKNLKKALEGQYSKLLNNKDFIQGEDVSEQFLEKYNDIPTERTQQLFKTLQELKQTKASLQDSFDVEGNLIGDPYQVEQTYETYNKLIEVVRRLKLEISGNYSEETVALKLKQDAEKAKEEIEKSFAKISNSKNFIIGKDLNNNYLKQYEKEAPTKNLDNLKEYSEKLENIKFQLKLAFDEQGNLIGDPTQVQLLLDRYDFLTQKIERLKMLIESPNSEESILKNIIKDEEKATIKTEKLTALLEKAFSKLNNSEKITTSVEKFLQPYFDLPVSESAEQMINAVKRIQNINNELASSFDAQGKLIGDPRKVQELIIEYNNLVKQIDELKAKISSPLSEENIALKLIKDAEIAQKELDKLNKKNEETKKQLNSLKNTIDITLGKSGLFEAQTQKTIDSYGAFYGNSEGKKGDLVKSNIGDENILPKNFIAQQKLVEELVEKLKEYKEAIKELQSLRTSDDATTEQLEETNNKVKDLKDNITTLSQTIKTSGIANASEEQISKLKNSFETFLDKNPNVAEPIRKQIEKYINTLSSGASVSKSAYSSMTTDLNKFKAAQASGSTIWEQMVGKMREGIAFLATKFSFYQIFNQFRQGFEVIHQFDDALTEMMKVSDETRLSLERYQKTTFDVADSIGTNALQIQNSTADFMRLGESLDQAAESARTANVLMNVSEFQSIDEATKSLIAMGAAYDDLSKMQIVDKLNEVGLKIA